MRNLYCQACLQVDKASFGYIFHQRAGGKAYYNLSHKVKQSPMWNFFISCLIMIHGEQCLVTILSILICSIYYPLWEQVRELKKNREIINCLSIPFLMRLGRHFLTEYKKIFKPMFYIQVSNVYSNNYSQKQTWKISSVFDLPGCWCNPLCHQCILEAERDPCWLEVNYMHAKTK